SRSIGLGCRDYGSTGRRATTIRSGWFRHDMMTSGQNRAVRELHRLRAADPDGFELVDEPYVSDGWLRATVAIRIGPIEVRDGGIDLREREEFILWVPSGFPFDRPRLSVAHKRFAAFPHVVWGKSICL